MKLPLPNDVFPSRIETARLRLRKPERRDAAVYARRAQEAYATRAQRLKYVDAWPTHWPANYDAIELGYSVVPSARGRGYVTEAALALLTAAFAAFDVASICAKCSHDNPKSAAVLVRCGMKELESTETSRRFEILR